MILNRVYHEDALITMGRMPDGLCNLIMTSPPYAKQREETYGGVDPDEFVEWFRPFCVEFKRILAQDGSLIINIGDVTVKGETHLFTFDIPIMLKRELGFCFIDPLIWHKKTTPPGRYPNRFKDAWEFCYHFSLQKNIKFRPSNVSKPSSQVTLDRYNRTRGADSKMSYTGSGFTRPGNLRRERKTGSGFGGNDDVLESGTMALPSNVLHLSPETVNKSHSAVYPTSLPEFFIKALTDERDIVYDPFLGSGTTAEVSLRMNRQWVGSELLDDHIPVINKRIYPFQNKLL